MKNWRADYPILVDQGHTVGSLATIRSLGRAGYPVIAASPQPDALAFHSRYCHKSLVQPSYDDQDSFSTWLDHTLRNHYIRLIIPSEALLLAIRPRFAEFRHLLPVPMDEALVYRGLSKYDLFRTCRDVGLLENLPPFLLIDDNCTIAPEQLRALGEPLFLKVDSTHARDRGAGGVHRCDNVQAATEKLKKLQAEYRRILVQGYVPGIGVGAFLARWRGDLLGEFMHRRLHEVPHWGGVSSLRESWGHARILADAHTRMSHLGWEGVGMFEYRWNPQTDRFYLMEFNSRFWGSLHLALFAGVDFPRLIVDAILGRPNPPVTHYPSIKCRLTFPREVEYVYSCLKDSALPWSRRIAAVVEFATLGLNPRIYSDLNFPGDRLLYGRMMISSIRRFLS